MYRSISSLIPDVADLLALEVEELAGVLLTHLNSRVDAEGSISQSAFFGSLRPGPYNANPECVWQLYLAHFGSLIWPTPLVWA
jgi:hypothetical protein